MAKSHRIVGYNTEWKAAQRAESFGYYVCRSAGSHGAADVIAVRHGEVLGIQVKHHNGKSVNLSLYKDDIARLRELVKYGMMPMLWVRLLGGKWYEYLVTDEAMYVANWIDNQWVIGEAV